MTRAPHAAAAASILYFAIAALSVIPYAGIAQDEALFAGGIYNPRGMADYFQFQGPVAAMLMPYVGALKSWLYAPLFRVWPPDVWSVRIPMLAAGVLALALLWTSMRRACGDFAAAAAVALASTDAVFILTNVFDWGPVALQHLFAAGAAACFVRFVRNIRLGWLAASALLAGLGIWDKALFVLTLGGTSIAALLVYRARLRPLLSKRAVAVAVLALGLASFPLIRYNVRDPWGTLRGNVTADANDAAGKANLLRWTLDGRALKGWLAEETENLPQGALPWLCLAGLAALPWMGDFKRPALFFLAAFALSWLPMLLTARIGGAAHHTILLWPLPACFAAAFATDLAARRWPRTAIALVALCCATNAAVFHSYRAQLIANGPAHAWTDAIFALAQRVSADSPAVVFANDWGFGEPLRLLTAGRIPVVAGYGFLFAEDPDLPARIADPAALHIGFVPSRRAFPEAAERIHAEAARLGFERVLIATIPDRRGHPVYEIYRFRPAQTSSGTTYGAR